MSPQEIRETLLERTISVIANDGLGKTTTKAIVTGTGINESYIYRHFSDKEDLLAKSFEKLDNELLFNAMQNISVMYQQDMAYEDRCRAFFYRVWDFLLSNREKCLAFVRYYYSPQFAKKSAREHKLRYEPLVERFCDAFKVEANVWMILNHMLNVILDFAVKAHNGLMPCEEIYYEHVFRVIYASVQQYFKVQRSAS